MQENGIKSPFVFFCEIVIHELFVPSVSYANLFNILLYIQRYRAFSISVEVTYGFSAFLFVSVYAAFIIKYRRRFCGNNKEIMSHSQDNRGKVDSGCSDKSICTECYKSVGILVHGVCTVTTRPLYQRYKAHVRAVHGLCIIFEQFIL